jgi:hypothetical protein
MTTRQRGGLVVGIVAVLFGLASPVTLLDVFPELNPAAAVLLVWGPALAAAGLGAVIGHKSTATVRPLVRTSVWTYISLGAVASTVGILLGRQSFGGEDVLMAVVVVGLVIFLAFLSAFAWLRGASEKASGEKTSQ